MTTMNAALVGVGILSCIALGLELAFLPSNYVGMFFTGMVAGVSFGTAWVRAQRDK